MSMGQPQPVEFFELHNIALETHTEYMLSSEFEILPQEIKMIFFQHAQEHNGYIQEQQAQAMAQQAIRQKQETIQAQQPRKRNLEGSN